MGGKPRPEKGATVLVVVGDGDTFRVDDSFPGKWSCNTLTTRGAITTPLHLVCNLGGRETKTNSNSWVWVGGVNDVH